MAEKVSGVYRLELGNGYFYIGRAVDVRRRIRRHKTLLSRGQHWNAIMQNVWNKHGEFSYSVVEECRPEDTPRVEAGYLFDNKDAPKCMNIAGADANGFYVPSEGTRKKISAAKKGKALSEEHRRKLSEAQKLVQRSAELCRKMAAGNRGRRHSEASRLKMSESKRGLPKSEGHRRKLSEAFSRTCILYTPAGFPLLFDSGREASEFLGCANVCRYLSGRISWPKRRHSPIAGWTGEFLPEKRPAHA